MSLSAQPKTSACHITVSGHVQGVGFRAWAAAQARHLGIHGWVKNTDDGSVEIFAESSDQNIRAFTDELRTGNGYSVTDRLTVNPATVRGYRDFQITY